MRLKSFKIILFTLISISLFQFSKVAVAETLPYLDSEFSCLSKEEANKYINDFEVDVNSFGGLELCNGQVDTKKLLNDLQIIEKGQFASTGQNLLIRNFIPASQYYSWMKSQTHGMNRGNDIPWATAYNSGGYFTMQDGWAKLSTLGRVGTVIHEARHTAGYRHIPCTSGPYGGTSLSGCDRDYAYGGSHGVEMEYYARVSVQGTNFHPVYKTMARLMAIARSNFVFNVSPIQTREALLLLDSEKKPILFDRDKSTYREVGTQNGRLKRTSFGAVLLEGLKAISIEMYEVTGFKEAIDDTYSYFKMINQPDSPIANGLVDFEEIDLGSRRYALALNSTGGRSQVRTYKFASGAWSNPSALNFEAQNFSPFSPEGQKGVFLISKNKEVFQINPENLAQQKTNQIWNSDLIATAVVNQRIYRLKSDHQLYYVENGQEKNLKSDIAFTDMVSVPLYDAFEVKF